MNLWDSHSTKKTTCLRRSLMSAQQHMKIATVGSRRISLPQNLTANYPTCITMIQINQNLGYEASFSI